MSRRESCVWHPMPEEVRRSSVQSRRASLAAGRRKSMGTNEPDWEVEAPPTPPRQDFTPRDNAVVAAAAAPPSEAVASTPQQASEAGLGATAPPAAAETEEIVSVKSEQPSERLEDVPASVLQQPEPEDAGKGRMRHTVRFHGDMWAKVLRKNRAEIEAAFLEDIHDAVGVTAEEAKRLKIKMHDCMEVTFVVYSDSQARQRKIHSALQQYKFAKTCKVYTSFSA